MCESVHPSNQTSLTVFTSPAVNKSWSCDHVAEMWLRINLLVNKVEQSGVSAMVFGAWGCGSFGLDSAMLAHLFKKRLACSSIPIVHFAILDTHSGHGNYHSFRSTLCFE